MTFPNPKYLPGFATVLDAGPAVDKGGGEVGFPITGHPYLALQVVIIAGSVNYNLSFLINSVTANEIVVTATYVAEVFTGAETVSTTKVVILKEDFLALENAISTQSGVRMQPPLAWDDAGQVRVKATADCPAAMQFTGMPNILNPAVQTSGGLSDGKVRTNTADETLLMATAAKLFGLEKVSQWYAVFAIAADADAVFTLKAMPIMRVCSDVEATKVISLGTLVTPATGRRYGFATDELVGGVVYILSGGSIGLMRAITANDNATGADGTSGTITYTGTALSLAPGDWFIVLPPGTNFRLVGTFFNNSASNIEEFLRQGNKVWCPSIPAITINNDISACCPFATEITVKIFSDGANQTVIYPDFGSVNVFAFQVLTVSAAIAVMITVPIRYCLYTIYNPQTQFKAGYAYPPGCGW